MGFRQQFTLVYKICLFIPGLLVFTLSGQSIRSQVIGSFGASISEKGITLQMVAGQPSNTVSAAGNNIGMRQGFLQGLLMPTPLGVSNLTVFPNPVVKELYVMEKLFNGEKVVLTSVSGQTILEKPIDADIERFVLDLQSLQSGLYILNVNSSLRKIKSTKIIKI